MKYYRLFALCALASISHLVKAEDVLPPFSMGQLGIRFPAGTFMISPGEESNVVDGRLVCKFEGQLFLGGTGKIPVSNSVTYSDRKTPWKALAELIRAYKAFDVTKIVGLYTAASRVEINQLYTDPALAPSVKAFLQGVQEAEILAAMRRPYGVLAFVKLTTTGGRRGQAFYTIQKGMGGRCLPRAYASNWMPRRCRR